MTEAKQLDHRPSKKRIWTVRRKVIVVLLVFNALVIPAAIGIPSQLEERDPLESAINDLGFFPTRPPTRLRGPGSLFHVGLDGSIKRTVCEADHVLVGSMVQQSETTLMAANFLQKANYALDAGIVDQINTKLDTRRVATVRYELNNVKVLEISADRLVGIAQRLMRNPDCAQAISQLVMSREYVCQGVSVLLASAKYAVEVDSQNTGSGSVSSEDLRVVGDVLREANVDQTVNVVPDLKSRSNDGVAASSSGSNEERSFMLTSGEGLHYGVKLDELCVAPSDATKPWRLPRHAVEHLMTRAWQLWPF